MGGTGASSASCAGHASRRVDRASTQALRHGTGFKQILCVTHSWAALQAQQAGVRGGSTLTSQPGSRNPEQLCHCCSQGVLDDDKVVLKRVKRGVRGELRKAAGHPCPCHALSTDTQLCTPLSAHSHMLPSPLPPAPLLWEVHVPLCLSPLLPASSPLTDWMCGSCTHGGPRHAPCSLAPSSHLETFLMPGGCVWPRRNEALRHARPGQLS